MKLIDLTESRISKLNDLIAYLIDIMRDYSDEPDSIFADEHPGFGAVGDIRGIRFPSRDKMHVKDRLNKIMTEVFGRPSAFRPKVTVSAWRGWRIGPYFVTTFDEQDGSGSLLIYSMDDLAYEYKEGEYHEDK